MTSPDPEPDPEPSPYALGEADVPELVAAHRRAAAAVRRVMAGVAGVRADPLLVEEITDQLEAAAARLAPFAMSRHAPLDDRPNRGRFSPLWEAQPFVGPSNALAVPLALTRDGERVQLTGTYGLLHEGRVGHVHGGLMAGAFDEILARAARLAIGEGETPVVTGTLKIRYLRPTPLHRPVSYTAWIARGDRRKVLTRGECVVDGERTAEAEAIFIRVGAPSEDTIAP